MERQGAPVVQEKSFQPRIRRAVYCHAVSVKVWCIVFCVMNTRVKSMKALIRVILLLRTKINSLIWQRQKVIFRTMQ